MTKKTKKAVQMIVVDADGEIITAANGHVSSDNPELVKKVKNAWLSVRLIYPFGTRVTPSLRDPENLIGITAALFSARPGRTRLLEAPAEVWEWMKNDHALRGGCISASPKEVQESDEVEIQLTDEEKSFFKDPEFYASVVAEGEKLEPEFEKRLKKSLGDSKNEDHS